MDQLIIDKILLISSAISLFLVFLFLRKKGLALHDYIMSAWLIVLGLCVFIYAFTSKGYFLRNTWLIHLYISLMFLNGPFLYFYVKALTKPTFARINGHALPFITILAFLNFFCPECHEINKVNSFTEVPATYFYVFFLLTFSILIYIVLSVWLLIRHKKMVADNFSDLEKRTLSWLRILIIILGIAWVIFASIIYTHHVLKLFSDSFCINGLFVTLSVFSVIIGYFGLYQPRVYIFNESIESKNKPYSGSTFKEDEKQQYIALLNTHMIESKPYLNSQLTLSQLSSETDIPLHQLSRIINEHYNQNFFDYINQLRVNEFIERLSDPKYSNYSLLGLAFDCGFNSKTAFNRFFKKSTGLTPSEFKKNI
jgi:AraC-like DNA-binding protein